jgi:ABC-type branched-subunit amino acid transport system ATPase component
MRSARLDILTFLGLSEFADAPASSLAYGPQWRAEQATASATEPDLLLLDEPAAGLNQLKTSGCIPHLRPNSSPGGTTARTTHVSRVSPACRAMGKAVGRRLAALPGLRRQTAYPVVL